MRRVERIPPEDTTRMPVMCASEVLGEPVRNYRVRVGQDMGCRYPAHYRIDGQPYCTRHAGLRALAILTDLVEHERHDG